MNGVLERANDFGDTTLAFTTNGTISLRRDYVVLGADGRSLGLAKDWIYDCAIVQMCNCANEEMGIC